jgi:predicted sugar kinase
MNRILGLAAFAVLVLALAGANASAEEAAATEMKGSAGCAGCAFHAGGCASAVKVGDVVYALQPSDKADEATQKLIKSFKGKGQPVEVVVKGVVKDKTIIADSVVIAEEKKG